VDTVPPVTYGSVLEIHEVLNQPYNNILGPIIRSFAVTLELPPPASAQSPDQVMTVPRPALKRQRRRRTLRRDRENKV
jgi:hypothetical protein